MLISQIMLVPWFVFCVWGYFRLSARGGNLHKGLVFDIVVLVLSVVLCSVAIVVVSGIDSSTDGRIWRPVLSTLTSFFIVPAVLTVAGFVRKFFVFSGRDS